MSDREFPVLWQGTRRHLEDADEKAVSPLLRMVEDHYKNK